MRTPRLLAAAAVSLLATTAVAHAQPSLAKPASSTSTDVYLEPGVEAGLTRSGTYGALQLDGGHRLGDSSLWLHGRLAHGGMIGIDWTTKNSDFTEARVGLEARGCALSGIACLVVGADVGYRHEMVMRASGIQRNNLGTAVGRLGLDLGSQHLRFRASVETGVDQGGWNGLGLTTGVAYAW